MFQQYGQPQQQQAQPGFSNPQGGALGNILQGIDTKNIPQTSTSTQGIGALPREFQAIYQQIAQMLSAPGGAAPGNFNQEQLGAYQQLAHPDYSNLANYLAPFQGLRDTQQGDINKYFDQSQGNLLSNFGGLGQGKGNLNPAVTKMLAELETGRNSELGRSDANFTQQAIGLQDKALQNQLGYGNAQYSLDQAQSPLGQSGTLLQLLGLLPQTSNNVQRGAESKLGTWGKVGGILNAGAGPIQSVISSLFGGGK